MRRIYSLMSLTTLLSVFLVGCNSSSPSCAATVSSDVFYAAQTAVLDRGGSGGTSSHTSSGGTHSSNSGSSTGRAGGSSVHAPSNSGTHSSRTPSNSGTHSPSSSSSSKSLNVGGHSYPTNYGHSYTYHGANGVTHVFVIHNHGYYHTGGFHDPFDPYDWTNFNNHASPYYHVHLHC